MLGYQDNQENQGYQLQDLVRGICWDTKITKKTRFTSYRTYRDTSNATNGFSDNIKVDIDDIVNQ